MYFYINRKRIAMEDLQKLIDEMVNDVSIMMASIEDWIEIENKLSEKNDQTDE